MPAGITRPRPFRYLLRNRKRLVVARWGQVAKVREDAHNGSGSGQASRLSGVFIAPFH